jgi:FAD/FMN-containing dehydrogenase
MASLSESARRRFRRAFQAIVGSDAVLTDPDELLVFESDGLTMRRAAADVIVFPRSTKEVAAWVKLANAEGRPFVARSAGTGFAGGCLPAEGSAKSCVPGDLAYRPHPLEERGLGQRL